MKFLQKHAPGERLYIVIVLSVALMSLIVLTHSFNQPASNLVLPVGQNLTSNIAAMPGSSESGANVKVFGGEKPVK